MISATLGDTRSDLIRYLGPFIGETKVADAYDQAISKVKSEASKGAKAGVAEEIPTIKREVKIAVTPLVGTAIALGAVGAALGLAALISVRRAQKRG